jgi:hypothetical protein
MFDQDKMEATGKLLKAYKVGGKQFGVMELTIGAPITGLGAIKVTEGKLSATMAGDGCIDGTSPEGKSTMTMKLTFNGGGKGFEAKGEISAKESRTTVVLPKQ